MYAAVRQTGSLWHYFEGCLLLSAHYLWDEEGSESEAAPLSWMIMDPSVKTLVPQGVGSWKCEDINGQDKYMFSSLNEQSTHPSFVGYTLRYELLDRWWFTLKLTCISKWHPRLHSLPDVYLCVLIPVVDLSFILSTFVHFSTCIYTSVWPPVWAYTINNDPVNKQHWRNGYSCTWTIALSKPINQLTSPIYNLSKHVQCMTIRGSLVFVSDLPLPLINSSIKRVTSPIERSQEMAIY